MCMTQTILSPRGNYSLSFFIVDLWVEALFRQTIIIKILTLVLTFLGFSYGIWLCIRGENNSFGFIVMFTYTKFNSNYRKIALTIILTRAGLDLDPVAMKKFFLTVIKLALVPWTFECCLSAVLSHFLLSLPWDWCKYITRTSISSHTVAWRSMFRKNYFTVLM